MRLILVRHGETDGNRAGQLVGNQDIPLNETGKQQAQRVAERLRSFPVAAVFSSDISRARQTAQFIAQLHNVSVSEDARLREINFGVFEGKPRAHWLAGATEK